MAKIKPGEKCCGSCIYWKRADAMDKAGRVRRDRLAPCQYAPVPPIPDSARIQWPVRLHLMTRDYGKTCPCHEPV